MPPSASIVSEQPGNSGENSWMGAEGNQSPEMNTGALKHEAWENSPEHKSVGAQQPAQGSASNTTMHESKRFGDTAIEPENPQSQRPESGAKLS